MLSFYCNICGKQSVAPRNAVSGRETRSCYHCGSTLRFRSVVHVVVNELLGEDKAMPQVEPDKSIAGIGLSDAMIYADSLNDRFDYQNTFYHQEPRLNIERPDSHFLSSADFVICSEVFEHIGQPVQRAFDNLFALLKPGGLCVFSVPYDTEASETVEHFPDLYDYRIVTDADQKVLINHTQDGKEQRYENLRFHGGKGNTLEMRLFSLNAVTDHIRRAGFIDTRVRNESCLTHGIVWPQDASHLISMRKPTSKSVPVSANSTNSSV